MTRDQIFFFERRQYRCWRVALGGNRRAGKLVQRRGAFCNINGPIAAAFEFAAKRDYGWKYGMGMPAPGQLADFRPGIGVEDVMVCKLYPRRMQ